MTTGAESDLVEATQLARRMLTRWGMGDLELVAFKGDEEHPFRGYELAQGRDHSEAIAARIDLEIHRLLAEPNESVGQLLMSACEHVDHPMETLLQEKAVDRDERVRILGPRPVPQLTVKGSHAGANDGGARRWGMCRRPGASSGLDDICREGVMMRGYTWLAAG